MKKYSIAFILFLLTVSSLAQVADPITEQKESGGRSLSLSQLLDSARLNNIEMRNARRSIETAQFQRKEAFTKYFPNISGTGMWFNANRGMAEPASLW